MRPRLAPDPTPPEQRTGSRWWDPPGELRGINLRSWLVLQLAGSPGPLSVAQLVERVPSSGLNVDGRASKTISDALRWETRRGRVVRLTRGHYAIGRLAPTTAHRMRRRLAACRARAHSAIPPIPAEPVVAEAPQVRNTRDLLTSIRVVAQMRNEPQTPHPHQPDGRNCGLHPPP